MAKITSPRSQNISEEDFFAGYRAIRSHNPQPPKVTATTAKTTSPRSQNISEKDSFAGYKANKENDPQSQTIITTMEKTTSPQAQNISEEDFFAGYKQAHLCRAALHVVNAPQHVVNAQAVSKVATTPITPPKERGQVNVVNRTSPDHGRLVFVNGPPPKHGQSVIFNHTSNLSPTAVLFNAPRTPSPDSIRNTSSWSSKLSPTAPTSIAPASAYPQPGRVPSSSGSLSKLSQIAAPFTTVTSVDPKPSPTASSTKLSPRAVPFSMAANVTSMEPTYEATNKLVQRTIIVPGKSGPWPQYGIPCNDDNLVTVDGSPQGTLEFDDCVSEAGVEDQPRQVVRATEGEDATNQLVDWDGKHWAPAPASWEYDRAEFTGTFIPNYIREWSQSAPAGINVKLDTNNDAFLLGKAPVDNDVLISPLPQLTILTNPKPDGDKPKLPHTSNESMANAINHSKMMEEKAQAYKVASKRALEEINARLPAVNQFAPSIEMYLRPAEPKDAAGIAAIYNAEMLISSIPELLKPVTVKEVTKLIDCSLKRAPFIVAIRGECPRLHSMHNDEQVIGYARAEPFEFCAGVCRFTASLHLYVHPAFRRKHIGYNLMDRLLHMLTPAHAYMRLVKWANPGMKWYHESNGCGTWHQLFFKFAVYKRDDPICPWLKDFLYGKFYFTEAARLISACRSSNVRGGARFMDFVFLQREATAAQEFEHTM